MNEPRDNQQPQQPQGYGLPPTDPAAPGYGQPLYQPPTYEQAGYMPLNEPPTQASLTPPASLPQGTEYTGGSVKLDTPPGPPPQPKSTGMVLAGVTDFGCLLQVILWLAGGFLSLLIPYIFVRLFAGLPIWPF